MTDRRWSTTAEGAPLGPGSILWDVAGDARCLLTGAAAGIMQLMLPGLGAGVSDHSNFFEDPMDRIWRSIPVIWGSIFTADDTEGAARGKGIRDRHTEISGTDHHGERYHALDPDVYWWAHATFTWEMLRARRLYWPIPLSRSQEEQLYAETVTWYRRYGLSERPVPPTLADFERRFDDLCDTELELTPAVQWVLNPAANPASRPERVHLPGPLGLLDGAASSLNARVMHLMVYGAFPDRLRRRLGLAWSPADRAGFLALVATVRAAQPAIARGALEGLWPARTPHLAPGSRDRVIEADESIGQRRRAGAGAASAHS